MLNMALSVTGAVTRRSRPILIGFTNPIPRPARQNPLKAT